ncbi:D-alanyl-D-alanine carboxypeptidase family protein [Streptomyces sp. NPDC001222]|uniref:D-alanyl-D-alanine carboxypeptidase family protein n=1 Tax=Streptomyces sp. NPDC001222 TaxID=3364548 RepID=UPI0036A57E81
MAGESPDRSRQHESSTETTSGSGDPVPGPAAGDRDPRLAMAGKTARVDQATTVLSTRELRDSSGAAADEAAPGTEGSSTAAEDAKGGEDTKGGKDAKGGARQEASLASWVRSADEVETEAGAEGETEGEAEGEAEGEGASGAEADAEAASEAESGAGGAAAESTTERDRSGGEEAGGSAPDEAESGDSGSGGAESGGAESDDAGDAGAGEAAGSSGEGSEGEVEEEPEGVSKVKGEDVSEEEPKGAADASEGAPASAATSEEEVAADEPSDDVAEAAASAGADADAEGSENGADDAGDKPAVDQPTAVFKTPRRPPVDQPTTMLKLGGSTKPSEKSEKSEKSGKSDSSDESTDKPAVDQPTTMLKLGGSTKPSEKSEKSGKSDSSDESTDKPAVDQPTTMLKLGGGAKAAKASEASKTSDSSEKSGKDEKSAPSWAAKSSASTSAEPKPEADSDSKPEGDSERTSTFIALKPLDEPRSTQPKTAQPKPVRSAPADATAALPRVGPERTAQQPLPPKPPLDLLAELTNTPPPPETPVRTALRRIKIWTPLAVLLVIIFAIVQAVRPLPDPTLGLSADETYTFGGGNLALPWPGQGQSAIEVEGVGMVGVEGKQAPQPIASVTKIMTAYVTLQEHPLKGNDDGPKITADQQAEDESKIGDESTASMKKGQVFTERQMLQMLMIPSGNNAARLLARWDSDSKTFVGKMNAAAKQLGMTNTTYTDPSGLEKSTVSTAVDQLKLAKTVMQNPVFRSIVGMAKADLPAPTGTIYNNNDLLVKQVGVIGLKTGSSTPAGGNLVWAATKVVDGRTQTIYGAVLNQDAHTGRVWDSLQLAITNSQKLIDKIQHGLTSATVVKKGEVVGYVDDQMGGRTPLVATRNMTAVGWPGLRTKLSIGGDGKAVPHEAKAGTVVGRLTVGDGSSHAVMIPVALQKDLGEPGYGARFTRLG